MVKRKWLRRLVWGLTGFLLLAIAVAVAVPLLVPADRVRTLIVDQVAGATGARVSLGKASVRVWPRLMLALEEGVLDGDGAALAAATGNANNLENYRVDLNRLEIDIAWRPLLSRRVETGKIRLIAPRIHAVTRPEKEASSGGRSGRASGSTGGGDLAWTVAVAGVEIRDGRVVWSEAGSGRSVEVAGWHQNLTGADVSLFADRLLGRAGSAGGVAAGPTAAEPVSLGLTTRIDTLRLGGFSSQPQHLLADLSLAAEVTLPADGAELVIDVQSLAWRKVAATGRIAMPLTAAADSLRVTWRLEPTALVEVAPQLLDLAGPVANERIAAWLAEEPLQSGSVGLTGKGAWPWPVTGRQDSDAWRQGMSIFIQLDDTKITLPGQAGSLQGDLTVAMQGQRWQLRDLDLRDTGSALTVAGEAAATPQAVSGRLTGQGDLAALLERARALLRWSGQPGRADSLPALAGRFDFVARLDARDPSPLRDAAPWLAVWREGRPAGVTLDVTGHDVELNGNVRGAPWVVPELTLQVTPDGALAVEAAGVAHATLAGTASVRSEDFWSSPRRAALEFTLGRLDIDALVALFQNVQTAAISQPAHRPADRLLGWLAEVAHAADVAEGKAPPGEVIPQDLILAISGSADRVILERAEYRSVVARGALQDRVLTVASLTGQRAGGEVVASGDIDYREDPYGVLDFQVAVEKVPTAALLAPYAPKLAPSWDGTASGSATGTCRLRDRDAVLSSLDLTGATVSQNGTYHAQQLLAGITPYLGARQDLQDIRYRDLSARFTVAGGRWILDGLEAGGGDTDWTGSGWVDFTGHMDMTLAVKLPQDFQPELGDLSFLADGLREEDGRIRLDLRLSGRTTGPAVALDLERAKAQAQDTVEEKVKEGLGGLLDKLKRK